MRKKIQAFSTKKRYFLNFFLSMFYWPHTFPFNFNNSTLWNKRKFQVWEKKGTAKRKYGDPQTDGRNVGQKPKGKRGYTNLNTPPPPNI